MNTILLIANVVFQYPSYFVFLCVVVGLLYALALYVKDRSFGEQSSKLNLPLGLLRFLSVTIICLLLLQPVVRRTITEKQAPIVVLAQDNSSSIVEDMTEEEQSAYAKNMQALEQKLGEQYEVHSYSFGQELREGLALNYEDKASNLAAFMQEIYDRYSNQNLGTIIMATDGIYNQGANPLYVGAKLNAPIYSVALGDTIPKKDLILKKIYNNQIAYLGDQFTVQVDLAAVNLKGKSTVLTIAKKGRKLLEKKVEIEDGDFFVTEELILDADKSGVQHYTVTLSSVEGEVSKENNRKDFYIDVLDTRQKILLLAESPHPDLAAIKRCISANKNYELELHYAEEFKKSLADYDLVILHQLPSNRNASASVLSALLEKRIPHLFVVGTQTNLNNFNQAQELLSITGGGRENNEVEALLQGSFTLFTLEEDYATLLRELPPLTAPFGTYQATGNAEVLLKQRIGSVETDYPLCLLGEERGIKKGVFAAEGMWKWRMADFMQNRQTQKFDQLLGKMVQYLATQEDKRRFRASVSDNLFSENESIVIDAELYNKNYERINEPEASVVIRDEQGKDYPYTFNKTLDAYSINAGYLPVGSYSFEATVVQNGEELKAKGAFSIQSVQLEAFETTADHNLLALLSKRTGGEVIYPDQLESILEKIDAKGVAKPILFDTVKTKGLIHEKWIFFLLVLLLSLEWGARRYLGSY